MFKVVSLDILLAGLPWEIKFRREFRSKLFGTGVPDILKFDVCVIQPNIAETTLNVWCPMKEVILITIHAGLIKIQAVMKTIQAVMITIQAVLITIQAVMITIQAVMLIIQAITI